MTAWRGDHHAKSWIQLRPLSSHRRQCGVFEPAGFLFYGDSSLCRLCSMQISFIQFVFMPQSSLPFLTYCHCYMLHCLFMLYTVSPTYIATCIPGNLPVGCHVCTAADYMCIFVKYSRLSLSRSRRDPLKHFEISVLRHIRCAELRKIPNEHPNFTKLLMNM